MKATLATAGLLACLATGALANPCGFDEQGRVTIVGYGVGQTSIPANQKARLAEFAETAKARYGVCIFAQVDKQGSDAANRKVADGRAEKVRRYLLSKGVPADSMKIAKQEEALTFFGLLDSDQDDDRRVMVTHD